MADCATPVETDAAPLVRGVIEARALEGVRMGYGPCTYSGCICQSYVDMYDGNNLCGNCTHDYSLHT